MVRICILDNNNNPVGFCDNDAPLGLHYYNDSMTVYIDGAASILTFTVRAAHPDAGLLQVGNKLAFIYKGRDYYFNIAETEQSEAEITVTALSLSFELLNELAGPYNGVNMSFYAYLQAFMELGIFYVGVNELTEDDGAPMVRSNEWTGTQTMLERLYDLAALFDAELEFTTELNQDYSLKRFVINAYKKHDTAKQLQGIGEHREDVTLRYGLNIDGITKSQDITGLYTAILPTGKDGLTLAGLGARTEYNGDGALEFSHAAGNTIIYAPLACSRFPSYAAGAADQYILYRYDAPEIEDVNELYADALAKLKELSTPKVTYNVDGYADVNIGDTVKVIDESFSPPLYIEARVVEHKVCFTDESKNKSKFSNVVELKNEVDTSLLREVEKMIKDNKRYLLTVTANKLIITQDEIFGVEDSVTLSATANNIDGSQVPADITYKWYCKGTLLGVGPSITVYRSQFNGKGYYNDYGVAYDVICKVNDATSVTTSIQDGNVLVDSTTPKLSKASDGVITLQIEIFGRTFRQSWLDGNYVDVPTAEISANTAARHTHDNKAILDAITSAPATAISQLTDDLGVLMHKEAPTNIDEISTTGIYDVTNANTGIPVAYTGYLLHIRQSSQAALQFYTRTTSTQRILYMRKKQNGSWASWGSITFTAI